MSIAPNHQILDSDLATLAFIANGKSQLPQTLDNGYQFWKIQDCSPVNPGIGYKAGDLLAGQFPDFMTQIQMSVMTVSDTGQIIGIKYVSRGAFFFQPATNLTSVTGGSGSGAQLFCTFAQSPATSQYSFSYRPAGVIRGIIPKIAGKNYQVGDSVNVALPSTGSPVVALTVNTVDINGGITSLSAPATANTFDKSYTSIAVTGGSGTGASVWIQYNLFEDPAWATELTRLRTNLNVALNPIGQSSTVCVSGIKTIDGTIGWPTDFKPGQYNYLSFYFADTGTDEFIKLSAPFAIGSVVTFKLDETGKHVITVTGAIIVSGTKPITINGTIGFFSDSTIINPPPPPRSLTLVQDLGIGTIQYDNVNGSIVWNINQVVSPGRYEATVTGSVPYAVFDTAPLMSGSGTISTPEYGPGVPVNGIHNSRKVLKIDLWDTSNSSTFSSLTAGLFFEYNNFGHITGSDAIYAIIGPFGVFSAGGNIQISITPDANLTGLWLAQTPMIGGNPCAADLDMPWNYVLTRNTTGAPSYLRETYNPMFLDNFCYNQLIPAEQQSEPPNWLPNKKVGGSSIINDGFGNFWQIYSSSGAATTSGTNPFLTKTPKVGDIILDNLVIWVCIRAFWNTSGDLWKASHDYKVGDNAIDSNGNGVQVTIAGTSGVSNPIWSLTTLGLTVEGSVTWKMTTPAKPYLSATHRILNIPRYPFYWLGNTVLPTTWLPSISFAVNATCIDSNGNTQRIVTAGISGATNPGWSLVLNGTTNDGTCVWKTITLSAETNAMLLPPTAGGSNNPPSIWGNVAQWSGDQYLLPPNGTPISEPGWQAGNAAYGWWIYSISINRFGLVNDKGFDAPQVPSIPVTIGCIRNNVFVPFGTYQTGQTFNVLWPIFTSDALVYTAQERVDLQAVAIKQPVSQSPNVGYPMLASYVGDTEALLNLIN